MSEKTSKRLKTEVYDNLKADKAFGLQIGVLKKGKLVFKESYGKDYLFFDLASLTKAMLTADYFLKKPGLKDKKISDVLPWLGSSKLKIKDLLNHSSGLRAHLKFFEVLNTLPNDERQVGIKRLLREEFKQAKVGSKPLYSDLDFMLLGFAIEELEECSLEHYFERENTISGLHFNKIPFNGKKTNYAPTEICPWRKKTLRGEVLDGNTYFMGGVAGHAGFFGSLDSVLDYGIDLRKSYKKEPKLFKAQNNEWASGFMIPSGDQTTAGKHFSKKSIGHLGFTGTSFWYDPEADLFITILSNRTYPDRFDASFNKFRPLIQNIIYEETT
jgi:CubicO group peptidase (beta-lactamase class C family)